MAGTPAGVNAATAQTAVFATTAGSAQGVSNTPNVVIQQTGGGAGGMTITSTGVAGTTMSATTMSITGTSTLQLQSTGPNDMVLQSATGVDINGAVGNITIGAPGGTISITADAAASLNSTTAGVSLSAPAGPIQVNGLQLGFFGVAPVIRASTVGPNPLPVGAPGAGAPVLVDTLFGDPGDATAQYTVGRIVQALRQYGILK